MGKEMSTLGGAVATTGTAVAAGVTFGQVKSLNNAVVSCAKYTGNSFMETSVRHVGEATGKGIATAATAVAAGVTFGQVDQLNDAVVACAKSTAKSSAAAAQATVHTVNDMVDGVPVLGHAKGAIHYVVGDKRGGDKAMKAASRTVGVVAGGTGGFLVGGPVGAVAGGIAGGATMDGIITGVDTAVHDEWRPSGQIAAWDAVAKGKTADEIIDGVVGGLVTPAFDALGGYAAGKGVAPRTGKPPAPKLNLPRRPQKSNQALKAGDKRPSTAPRGPKAPGTGGSALTETNPSVTGKARASTVSTRASTTRTSVESVFAEQNLEGNVGPIPRNKNTALNTFMEQESTPQPKQPQLQPQPPASAQPHPLVVTVNAAGPSKHTSSAPAKKTAAANKTGKASKRGQGTGRGGGRGRGRGRGRGEKRPERPERAGGPGGPGGPGRGGGQGRQGLSMSHPDGFHENFGISDEFFATFEDQGNGTFIATNGFDFVHAQLTTPDKPTTIATITGTEQNVQASSAGALWARCTGSNITSSTCAVSNCTNLNSNCSQSPLSAGATAHVYLTCQKLNHEIEYMVLVPTCAGCNNHIVCSNTHTNYPPTDQAASVLRARPGTQVMFIRCDRNTAGRKGGKGKGKGDGGSFGGPFNPESYKGKGGSSGKGDGDNSSSP